MRFFVAPIQRLHDTREDVEPQYSPREASNGKEHGHDVDSTIGRYARERHAKIDSGKWYEPPYLAEIVTHGAQDEATDN